MNIVIYKSEEIVKKDGRLYLVLSDRRAVHISKTLKLKEGDNVKLGEFNVALRVGKVVDLKKKKITIEVLNTAVTSDTKKMPIELILAMPRPQTLKKVIELSSTFSISELRLVDAGKVEKSYFSSKILSDDQIEKHIVLGLEQGRKVIAPRVQIDRDFFKNKFEDIFSQKIILHQFGNDYLVSKSVSEEISSSKRLILAIGPEGGWANEEVVFFENKGFLSCSLGQTPLRVENAVCSVLSTIEQFRNFNSSVETVSKANG